MREVKGRITKIIEKTKKNGQPFRVFMIEEKPYSVFDDKFFGEFSEGDNVIAEYSESNGYRNIQSVMLLSKAKKQKSEPNSKPKKSKSNVSNEEIINTLINTLINGLQDLSYKLEGIKKK